MANNFSFDIVSEVDLQEVDNAVNQAKKEIATRYDFRNSKSSVDFNRDEKKITLVGDDNYKIKIVMELLAGKLGKRGIPVKSLDMKPPKPATGDTVVQEINVIIGIDKDKARELVKIIKDLKIRSVQVQIEDVKLRVISPKKDDLQAVISHLRGIEFPLALQFTNYR